MSTKRYSMLEIINKIKSINDQLNRFYDTHVAVYATDTKYMVSLYNPNSGLTINGDSKKDREDYICSTNTEFVDAVSKLIFLLKIKDYINSNNNITVTNISRDGDITLSVSVALSISNSNIKKYQIGYTKKLADDYKSAIKAKSNYDCTVMSNDKICDYVNAKLYSRDSSGGDDYESIAQEYREANKMEILDPLDIPHTAVIEDVEDFYARIRAAITVFNVQTRVWIESDDEGNYISWWKEKDR